MNNSDKTNNLFHSLKVPNAFLVGVHYNGTEVQLAENLLYELASLTRNIGLQITGSILVRLNVITPRYLLGTGKTQEIISLAKEHNADCIIIDAELTPSQQRNWEKLSGLCAIDRHEVILEIFAAHASTREAVLQVGLARMEYSLPRLKRAWTHLSRQRGGLRGTRGEGEAQLEVDRRIVLRKIDRMKKELAKVHLQRALRRKQREKFDLPTASFVGYTNAGKSSLLNRLSDSKVLVEDKLFATLDPTTRRIELDNGQNLLLTDTVGFIRKLPHDLIDAFKSTLEEVVLSDFLILVLDASSPEITEHYTTTMAVLRELEAADKPII
ncbi:MAG: GTPase HflX, partial [Spirochaetota bacterium]